MTHIFDPVWNPEQYTKNSEANLKDVKYTIDDLSLDFDKVMVCGKAARAHPDFHPRFSTPSTNYQSDLYVLVDHTSAYVEHIKHDGNYALSIIVHPDVVKEIKRKNGNIFWFSPDYLQNDLPKIIHGKFPIGNSGLSEISIAAYKSIKHVLISGINLTNEYSIFLDGKELIFRYAENRIKKIHSLDGILAEKISYEDWLKL